MKMKIILMTLMMIFIIGLVTSFDPSNTGLTTLTSPTDEVYDLDGAITFTLNGSPEVDYNITSIEFYTNHSGTWQINQTFNVANPKNNTAVGNITILSGLTDPTHLVWNARINYSHQLEKTVVNESLTWLNSTLNQLNNTHLFSGTFVIYNQTSGITIGANNYTVNPFAGTINLTTNYFNNTQFGVNYSFHVINSTWASANKTVFVEFPPLITLNAPTDGSLQSQVILFNITVDNSNTTTNLSNCNIYSNESGTWTTIGSQLVGNNNTPATTSIDFQDGNVTWNARCVESNNNNVFAFAESNFTFTMDKIVPVVVHNNTNDSYSINATPELNYTPSDNNLDACLFYLNVSGSTPALNQTHSSLTSGTTDTFDTNLTDGNYTYYFSCNDTAANWKNSTEFQIRIDLTMPHIDFVSNSSRPNSCNEWLVNVSTDEPTNLSIQFGNTTAVSSTIADSRKQQNHTFNLTDQLRHTHHYFNLTVCDVAGNCNETQQYDYSFGFPICSGWTYSGIYEAKTNFSNILAQSGATYVYMWNATGQDWIFDLGTGARGDEPVEYGDVVALFQEGNSSWAQNRSGSGFYVYNITSGENFLAMTDSVAFGDLVGRLMNSSDSWGAAFSTIGAIDFNFTSWAAYNKSAQDWNSGYYYDVAFNSSFLNDTILENATDLEVVWFYSSRFNLTLNGTEITGNWTTT